MPAKLKLVVGYDTLCYELLYNNGLQVEAPIEELNCDHEEADTRMFLHAKHAANSSSQVVIKSQDTDVFVLALDVAQDIACLVLSTGRNDKARLIDINKAAGLLGRDLCCALVAAHAPSGCDSVSSFYGKGKKKMFDLVKQDVDMQYALTRFGSFFKIDEEVIVKLQELVCKLYGVKEKSLNSTRYVIYCSSAKLSERSLPPTEDEFMCHARRAWYQIAIWRSALKSEISPLILLIMAGYSKMDY